MEQHQAVNAAISRNTNDTDQKSISGGGCTSTVGTVHMTGAAAYRPLVPTAKFVTDGTFRYAQQETEGGRGLRIASRQVARYEPSTESLHDELPFGRPKYSRFSPLNILWGAFIYFLRKLVAQNSAESLLLASQLASVIPLQM